MYKKFVLALMMSWAHLAWCEYPSLVTILQNCATFAATLETLNMDAVRYLLTDPEMRQSLLISMITTYQKNRKM